MAELDFDNLQTRSLADEENHMQSNSILNTPKPVLSSPHTLNSTTETHNTLRSGALHQLSDLLGENLKLDNFVDLKGNPPTIPINDLRGEEATKYSREECVLRRSLSALYRLIDIQGWTHSIYNHISARSTSNPQHFLINPFGLLYHEIQASSLIKIDDGGNIIQQGSTVLGVNKAAWTLHSALHASRVDINCILHVHVPDVIAVSCIRAGLLPVSPEATELLSHYGVRYHDYNGILVDEAERSSIQTDLGPRAKVLFLRNHGVAVVANSIAEAWYIIKRVVAACQTQMRMLQLAGGANLLPELKEIASDQGLGESALSNGDGNMNDPHMMNGKAGSETGDISWSTEDLEFEAEMRVLDSAGFRTGHIYRQPNLLRQTHTATSWAGDTLGDQMTGAELLTTDFSANECGTFDDVAAAEAVGAEQVAKIMDHVKANRQKGNQRNQWLRKCDEPGDRSMVTSSLLASPVSSSQYEGDEISRPAPQRFHHSELSAITPVKRVPSHRDHLPVQSLLPSSGNQHNSTLSSPGSTEIQMINGHHEMYSDTSYELNGVNYTSMNKSATLPANVQHLLLPANNAHSNTLQSVDGHTVLSSGDETGQTKKKHKKLGSFRIPSFSKKKKN